MLASSFISKIYFFVYLYPKNYIFTISDASFLYMKPFNSIKLYSMQQNCGIKRNDLDPPYGF